MILVTLPVMPLLWVPIRDGVGPPATFTLSTLIALGGVWVFLRILKVLSARENRSLSRVMTVVAGALVLSYFLWRLGNPVEKIHFFEYGFLSYMAHRCVRSTRPGLGTGTLRAATLGLAGAVGVLDEGIQHFLPNRYGDLRDLGFNLLAAGMGLVATELLVKPNQREIHVDRPS